MKKKIETLAELKGEEVRLRDKMESGIDITTETAHAWLKAQRKVKELESWLLWTIVSLVLILFIGGCGTFDGLSKLADGVRSDVHHITQPVDKEK